MMRMLVTGSRDWTDWQTLSGAMFANVRDYGLITVVHGDCPTGADAMADWVAKNLLTYMDRVAVEPHPADWSAYGSAAGPRRNREMVTLGADICLAFIKNESRGASHTAGLAEKAGIPTIRFFDT